MKIRGEFSDFDFSHYGEGMTSYAIYEPAYRLGYELAVSDAHRNKDWLSLEAVARRAWKELYPDRPWSENKEAVRFAWLWVKQMLAAPI